MQREYEPQLLRPIELGNLYGLMIARHHLQDLKEVDPLRFNKLLGDHRPNVERLSKKLAE